MEKIFQKQVKRIDRLMKIVETSDPHKVVGGLSFSDVLIFACQSMWHLKDWIINDPEFGAANLVALKEEIHSTRCLLICADLANGTKHLSLEDRRIKVGGKFSDRTGLHIDTAKEIFQELYYIHCDNPADEFFGIEIRKLLRRCRDTWEDIINRHYLSQADT